MFDLRTEPDNNNNQAFDPFRTINDRNDSWRSGSYGARARKTAENYQTQWNLNVDGVQFRPRSSEDESGVHSPRYNPSTHRSLSPTSRTQAIASGQRELMEMVKNMPESSYELSLKDLVQHPRIESPREESCLLEGKSDDDQQVSNQRGNSIRRQESKQSERKKQILRSGSMENRDLFLKMVFPISFKSRKKKNLMTNTFAKVSPKPEVFDKSSKTVEKDWWSNGGSTGSSNSGRKRRGFLSSCFSCFHSSKSVE